MMIISSSRALRPPPARRRHASEAAPPEGRAEFRLSGWRQLLPQEQEAMIIDDDS